MSHRLRHGISSRPLSLETLVEELSQAKWRTVSPAGENHSRRRFLRSLSSGTALAFATVAGSSLAGIGGVSHATANAADEIRLSVNKNQDLFRVRMEIDVKGNVNLVADPLVRNGKRRMLPLEANLTLDFEERFLRPSGATAASAIIAAERRFHEAVGTGRLSKSDQQIELRESVREVIARREQLPETIYSHQEYLTHEEVDLLRTPIASAAIDALVPEQLMRTGEKASIAAADLASFFNLSSVATSDVEIELVSADAAEAKLQLRGKIDGSVSGVPTLLRVVGKMTLDRGAGAVTWAAIAIHETREIGNAEPGFDVTATIRMVRKPLSNPQSLSSKPAKIAFDEPPPQDRLLVAMSSKHVGVQGLMDRRWRVMKDLPGEAILRMIENDRSIAQLNMRPLARLPAGEQLTLEAFESDVQKTLGDRFGELIESQEGVTDGGLRMLRVVVGGQVEGVPIQWIMMHFSDDNRHRVLATWTMDGQSVPQLAGSDTQLAASLQLTGDSKDTGESDSPGVKNSKNLELSAAQTVDEVESEAAIAASLSPSDVKTR
ncbi:hypothetical protein [Allorhodopirellula heiligendammensis]|uniref:Uncharacterized protein n=1 Tax=Allorhodopirellula heiligendammensis TaxID=2714739 RepID=A0A5C6BEK9_9BACT|nr:hypothetical protein [Allorhodopirellula heiligendammensis]TWU10488.1 hypothetical protein Poly21_43920 [Allorhodopirellula heiligendammensis]